MWVRFVDFLGRILWRGGMADFERTEHVDLEPGAANEALRTVVVAREPELRQAGFEHLTTYARLTSECSVWRSADGTVLVDFAWVKAPRGTRLFGWLLMGDAGTRGDLCVEVSTAFEDGSVAVVLTCAPITLPPLYLTRFLSLDDPLASWLSGLAELVGDRSDRVRVASVAQYHEIQASLRARIAAWDRAEGGYDAAIARGSG